MSTPIEVSDFKSNAPEQLEHAIKLLRRSPQRRRLFEAIYRGKGATKTMFQLASVMPGRSLGRRRIRVLQEGRKLAANGIVRQGKNKKTGETNYSKIDFYAVNYRKILDYATHPRKLRRLVTKRQSFAGTMQVVKIKVPQRAQVHLVTVDDIDSFAAIRKIRSVTFPQKRYLSEKRIKVAFQKIIQESGSFKDWGGEQSDLYTTKIKLKRKRVASAVAFKGPGTSGTLTPEKMGKRGTQVTRLFQEPAQLFLIVYCGQIHPYVLAQMKAAAIQVALVSGVTYFGVIDGDDLKRLVAAYPRQFSIK